MVGVVKPELNQKPQSITKVQTFPATVTFPSSRSETQFPLKKEMSVPRWIVVDDTNPDIQYDGPWFHDPTGSQNALGSFGAAYQNSLHGTTQNASLSYNFSGSQVQVYGTNNLLNDSGVLDPSWECFVDGISIGATTPFGFPENNWLFCSQETLVDGPHVLTVNATVRKSQTFWFDQIQYVPSLTVPLDGKAILIENSDAQLQTAYGSGWTEALGSIANMTEQVNTVFIFEFTGVSLGWYGFTPTDPLEPSTGSYSVDQGTAVNFPLPALPPQSTTAYNQLFFQTANLTQGKHQIVVLFDGNGQTTPLTLEHMIIQNGSISATTTGIGSTSTNSPSPISGNHTLAKKNMGVIVAAVIGGLVLVSLTILGVYCIRRRRKQIEVSSTLRVEPQPFIYSPVPIMNSSLNGSQTTSQPTPRQSNPVRTGDMGYGGGRKQISGFSLTTTNQSVDPPSTALSRRVKLQREAEATAAALRPQPRNNRVPSSLPLSDSSASNPSRTLMHQDSGIRLHGDPAEAIQEIPPQYTVI